ncbi:MAG TPA: Gfo/Idh/MocA family oxidoreductase, partial [Streptosporangiaceae bacterium]
MAASRLRVAVVGTGSWAQRAHLPGWERDSRAEVVAVADTDPDALASAAARFGVPRAVQDYRDLLDDPDIDVIDVVTGNRPHFEISWDALQAGKHVLCEKPVHPDYRETRQAAELATAKGLKTKVGFTFRYAPATRFARELIDAGFVGEPFMFNGFEQNSQWIDPATPLRQVDQDADPAEIAVSSIEGYGAPVIDIMHWWVGAPLQAVVGTMRNFVPVRMVRDTGQMTRVNIDDGDMWIAEFSSGALASIQSSYVTVGNYPGIEARIYGSEGAIIVRLVDEFGICQTIKTARKDAVEFTELD